MILESTEKQHSLSAFLIIKGPLIDSIIEENFLHTEPVADPVPKHNLLMEFIMDIDGSGAGESDFPADYLYYW